MTSISHVWSIFVFQMPHCSEQSAPPNGPEWTLKISLGYPPRGGAVSFGPMNDPEIGAVLLVPI